MRGGLRLNPANPFHQTVQVAVDYVRFRHVDKFVKFHNHVRSLPNEVRLLTWAALALAGVVVIATPLLAGFASRFTSVSFQDVQDQTRTIPTLAIALAFLAFSMGWGYLLAGAAQGPAPLWILAGLLYSYLILIVGLSTLRFSPLHAIPMLLLVAMGALTPGGSAWGKIGLLVLMTSFFVRVSLPIHSSLKDHWYLVWPVAIAAAVAVHRLLARRPWPSPIARTALAFIATAGYFFLIAVTTGNWANFAAWVHVAFNTVISYLDVLWFLLGASFVGGAIALALFTRKAIERIFPPAILHWAILGGWIALAAWALRAVPSGVHGPYVQYAMGILLASLLVLVAWWRVKRITQEWLAGWFVASAAAVLSLRTYLTLDVGSFISGKADARVLLGFAYAITWEIASHVRSIPLSMRGFPQPAPVLLYLGMVLTICGASLFGLSANLKYFQEDIVINEYQGALTLGLPLGLLAAAGTWAMLPHGVVRRCVAAFLLAALAAIPAFLVRAAAGAGVWPLIIAGLMAFGMTLAWRWPEINGPLAGAALGCAAGLGFAVVLAQRHVFVDILWLLMLMVGAFSGVPGASMPGRVVQGWTNETVWGSTDVIAFVVAAPLMATLAGAVLGAVKQTSRPALVTGENAPARAPATRAAHE